KSTRILRNYCFLATLRSASRFKDAFRILAHVAGLRFLSLPDLEIRCRVSLLSTLPLWAFDILAFVAADIGPRFLPFRVFDIFRRVLMLIPLAFAAFDILSRVATVLVLPVLLFDLFWHVVSLCTFPVFDFAIFRRVLAPIVRPFADSDILRLVLKLCLKPGSRPRLPPTSIFNKGPSG